MICLSEGAINKVQFVKTIDGGVLATCGSNRYRFILGDGRRSNPTKFYNFQHNAAESSGGQWELLICMGKEKCGLLGRI